MDNAKLDCDAICLITMERDRLTCLFKMVSEVVSDFTGIIVAFVPDFHIDTPYRKPQPEKAQSLPAEELVLFPLIKETRIKFQERFDFKNDELDNSIK